MVEKKWYHERIIKSRIVKGTPGLIRSDDDEVKKVVAELRRRVEVGMGGYLRTHHPCQALVSTVYKTMTTGLLVIVAGTLYGPADIHREILEEFIQESIEEER